MNSRAPASRHALEMRSAQGILALLGRHRDDECLRNLLDNLWLSGERVCSRLTPGGPHRAVSGDRVASGDRWPNEIPALYCSHLTSRPIWPSDEMCELLERNVAMFHDEFAGIDPSRYQVDLRDQRSGLTDGRNWTVFPFFDGSGESQVANLRRCPRIAEFLTSQVGIGRVGCMAFFSIMNAGTHVPRHTSQLNTRMRYHLGIEVPDRHVRLRVHDQTVTWTEGKCIKIDDSYEHEVFQQSDRRRVVFVVDLPHPELSAEELEFLQNLMRCSPPGRKPYGVSTIDPLV